MNGNVTRSRDANGASGGWWIDRTYDAADRPLAIWKGGAGGDSVLAELGYDGVNSDCPGDRDLGKLTHEIAPLTEFGGSSAYMRCIRYSGLGGRPDHTRVELTLPGKDTWFFEDHLEYNNRGLIVLQEYPSVAVGIPALGTSGFLADGGNVHAYTGGWHESSTFKRASVTLASASVQTWHASGIPVDVAFGNDISRHVKLDDRQRIARISVESSTAALWDSGSYEYDALSEIRSIGVAPEIGTHPETFTHDAHGRLVMAELPGSSVTYGFDAFGNMSSRVGAPWPSTAEGGFSGRVFSAGGVHDNRIHDAGWAHDAAGNVVAEPGGRTMGWDALGRLRHVGGSSVLGRYGYDVSGERVVSEEPDGWHFTFRGGGAQSQAEYVWSAVGGWTLDREYCLGPEGEYAELKHGATVTPEYYGKDHLGTPRVATDASGAVIALHLYEPFGIEKPIGGGADAASHRFTGHERDEPTGLDYMHARYYASGWSGRFLSPDPGFDADVTLPQSWNRFAYVRNSPVTAVDPDGRSAAHVVVAGALAAAYGYARHQAYYAGKAGFFPTRQFAEGAGLKTDPQRAYLRAALKGAADTGGDAVGKSTEGIEQAKELGTYSRKDETASSHKLVALDALTSRGVDVKATGNIRLVGQVTALEKLNAGETISTPLSLDVDPPGDALSDDDKSLVVDELVKEYNDGKK